MFLTKALVLLAGLLCNATAAEAFLHPSIIGKNAYITMRTRLAVLDNVPGSESALDSPTRKPAVSMAEVQDNAATSMVSRSMQERLLEEATNTCGCSDSRLQKKKKTKKLPTQLLIIAGVGILTVLVAAEEGMLFQ